MRGVSGISRLPRPLTPAHLGTYACLGQPCVVPNMGGLGTRFRLPMLSTVRPLIRDVVPSGVTSYGRFSAVTRPSTTVA